MCGQIHCQKDLLQGIQQGSVFLQFLFMVLERKKLKAVVRRLPRCYFLTVSLYYTLRTINVNYLLHI